MGNGKGCFDSGVGGCSEKHPKMGMQEPRTDGKVWLLLACAQYEYLSLHQIYDWYYCIVCQDFKKQQIQMTIWRTLMINASHDCSNHNHRSHHSNHNPMDWNLCRGRFKCHIPLPEKAAGQHVSLSNSCLLGSTNCCLMEAEFRLRCLFFVDVVRHSSLASVVSFTINFMKGFVLLLVVIFCYWIHACFDPVMFFCLNVLREGTENKTNQ